MKIQFSVLFMSLTIGLFSQVETDKPIQMTGADGQRSIKFLEPPVDGTDAANKDYVDAAVASSSGSSTLDLNLSVNPSTAVGVSGLVFVSAPITVTAGYVSGVRSPVSLNLAGTLPAGVTYTMSPGGGFPDFTSQIIFSFDGSTPAGLYNLTLEATGGISLETAAIVLDVRSTKRIFVTSSSYPNGNLGGLSGADNKCQTAANAVPALAGSTWKAWLSDNSTNAINRINEGIFITTTGTVLATSKANLTDPGNTNLKVNKTETGSTFTGQQWTGTYGNGNYIPTYNCNNWTNGTNTYDGAAGYNNFQDSRWTDESRETCASNYLHLYCVEQ